MQLDVAQHAMFARLRKRDRDAALARATGPADAMDVRVGRGRNVEVDDVRDVFDIESARGHVGRDQYVRGPGPEAVEHAIPLFLREPAVQRFGLIAATPERLREFVDFGTRAAEHDRRRRTLHIDDARERCGLVLTQHDVCDLANLRFASGLAGLVRNRDVNRVFEMALGDRADARRERRREQRRLAFGVDGGENRIEFVGETHVEHLVGFVEHEKLDVAQIERLTVDVVERAARSRDHYVDAARERAQLLAVGRAAEDRQHRDAQLAAVLVDGFRDLHRQLARRHQDQALDDPLSARIAPDPMDHGQCKCGRFAGSGGGLPEHVASGDQRWNCGLLNLRRLLVAERGGGGNDAGVEAEGAEAAGRFYRIHTFGVFAA